MFACLKGYIDWVLKGRKGRPVVNFRHHQHQQWQYSLFEPQVSIEDSDRHDPVFTSLDFATVTVYQGKLVSLISIRNVEKHVIVFVPPPPPNQLQGSPHWVPFPSPSTTLGATVEVF
jgi:hypothetical protein